MLELGFSFFHITLSLVRIEHDQKLVAFSHSYDHFGYLATAFTNMRRHFKVSTRTSGYFFCAKLKHVSIYQAK